MTDQDHVNERSCCLIVFFKSKDADMMTAAFKEYSAPSEFLPCHFAAENGEQEIVG